MGRGDLQGTQGGNSKFVYMQELNPYIAQKKKDILSLFVFVLLFF